MRRGCQYVLWLAAGSLVAGQVDAVAQNAPKAGQPAAARPAVAPDQNRMKILLQHWEEQSTKLKSLDVKMRRVDTMAGWPDEVYEGRAILQTPNLAWLNFQKVVADPKQPGKKVLKDHERIVCTGTEVWQYRSDAKQIFIFPLERQQQKRALEEGPLPFLFNMRAAEAEARYEMNLMNENAQFFVISVRPKLKIDLESFSKAVIRLDRKTFLPDRIFLLSPNGKDSKDFTLRDIMPNAKVAAANFVGKPIGPPWAIVKDPGDQQVAPPAAGIGNRQAPPAAGNAPRRR